MGWFGFLFFVLAAGAASAATVPVPPCTNAPIPSYPAAAGAPALESLTVKGWAPPACLGWENAAPTLLVALAGRLHEAGGLDALLNRFGAVSSLRGVRYWSVTDHAWLTLVTDATATADAAGHDRRGDYQSSEMQAGAALYSAERDGRSADAVIYRMRVLVRTPDRLVINVANVSPVRMFLVTLFAPGELQTTYFLDRLGPSEWGFYGLWGVTTGLLTSGHAKSSINRAMALYRHFAGIQTDLEPPAAR